MVVGVREAEDVAAPHALEQRRARQTGTQLRRQQERTSNNIPAVRRNAIELGPTRELPVNGVSLLGRRRQPMLQHHLGPARGLWE